VDCNLKLRFHQYQGDESLQLEAPLLTESHANKGHPWRTPHLSIRLLPSSFTRDLSREAYFGSRPALGQHYGAGFDQVGIFPTLTINS